MNSANSSGEVTIGSNMLGVINRSMKACPANSARTSALILAMIAGGVAAVVNRPNQVTASSPNALSLNLPAMHFQAQSRRPQQYPVTGRAIKQCLKPQWRQKTLRPATSLNAILDRSGYAAHYDLAKV